MENKKSTLGADFSKMSAPERAHLIVTLVLSAVIFASAVWLVISCSYIYFSGGDSPFTREVVAEHLGRVTPISLVCLALVIAAGILSLYVKASAPKRIPLSARTTLKFARKRLPATLSEEFIAARDAEARTRKVIYSVTAALSAVFAAVALIFILDPERYASDNFNLDIAYSVVIAAVSTVASLAACYVAAYFLDLSYKRETEAVRAEALAGRQRGAELAAEDAELERLKLREGHATLLVRCAVLVLAIVFIIVGIFNGGMADVLGKAVRICTECIGLG